jgi:fumarate reductase flavoprotein subunit
MADAVRTRTTPAVSRAAAEDVVARAVAPLARETGGDLYGLQSALRDVMWERVGLVRDGAGLRDALGAIARIEAGLAGVGVPGGPAFNVAWHDWLNLSNQVAVSRLIAMSAMERQESRGAHYRRDCPATDPGAPYVVRVRRVGTNPMVSREPVAFTRRRPEDRAASVTTARAH